jgi:hypothetical protein
MKPIIEFISLFNGLESIEECRPKPAKNFIPQWFKDIPSNQPSTVKMCPSFTDYFSMGYVLPMWADTELTYDKDINQYQWSTPNQIFEIDIHENNQLIDHANTSFQGVDGNFVFKMICPWRIITPPGWSVLQLPLFYHFNKDWSVLPGIIDTDIWQEINQQILHHGDNKKITIKRGTPLALYVPFKRDSVSIPLEVRSANDKDIKILNNSMLNFKTLFGPGAYRKMQRKRDKNV